MEKELKYIEKIDSIENESEYVKRCFTAMRMLAANPNIVRNTEANNSFMLERNYILSMVYNMGKSDYLRENTNMEFGTEPCHCFVGGETNKHIQVLDMNIEKICEELNFAIKDDKIEVIPDLVIHDSHNPLAGNTKEGQYLALEAKTTKRLGQYYFNRDFFKLNLYLAGLHFQNAVYLVINKSVITIDDYIGTYMANHYCLYCDLKRKVRFFIQENDVPEMYKLK